ncbi:MAG: hypothetical protein OHK0029_15430 [Armatimonadaceae bacterium]
MKFGSKSSVIAALGTALFCGSWVLLALQGTSIAQTASKPPTPAEQKKADFFEAKVRPLLINKCQPCHNSVVQQGGVRLDTREFALKTVTPGNPAKSSLITVVHYNGKVKMPPTGKLSDAEIATLEKWVSDGAVWLNTSPAPSAKGNKAGEVMHWSFRPVRRPLEPPVDKSGIDAFILAKLEQKKLTLAPQADRRTLLRRLSFDLIGLPPTPQEMEAFLADPSPMAYARQVDRLLASPRFGERWGRHWLDVARYADSNGLDENLAHGNAYLYRDWVIEAHNRDLPYDEFIRQQIAGDLMPTQDEDERNRRLIATGYLTLGPKVLAEQDKPKLVMDIIDEQIDVVTKSVMGITVACARCHDHKFDPVSTKDYYALAGIFKSTKTMANLDFVSRWNERSLPTRAREAEIAKYKGDVLEPLEVRLKQVTDTANRRVSEAIKADAPKYVRAAMAYAAQPGALVPLEGRDIPGKQVIEAESFARGNALKNFDQYGKDIGVIHTGASPTHAEWDVTVPAAQTYQLDIRYSAQESRPFKLLVNGKEAVQEAAKEVTGSWTPETQQWETVGTFPLQAGKNVLRLERGGAIPHVDKLALAPVPAPAPGSKVKSLTEFATEGSLNPGVLKKVVARISGATDEANALKTLQGANVFDTPDKPETFYTQTEKDTVKAATEELQKARENAPRILMAMAVDEQDAPQNVKVHIRGDTQTLGEIVPRGFPKVLCGTDSSTVPEGAGSGRLELANWMVRAEHPLTARVAVNRVWLHLFGNGLVATPDNWGLRGETPSHPELLDWLAHTFIHEDDWSLKKLIRRIVLSDTYRQASAVNNPRAAQVDPENRLLWRQNMRRLEAEPLRDAIHAVAGTLDLTMGGTLLGTRNGDYVTNDQSANAAQYNAPRRAIYLPVIRNAVYDFFATFDFGDPSMVNAQRASTIVAPQALFLLNSELVRKQASSFASLLLKGEKPHDLRIRQAIARAYARPATASEIAHAQQFLTNADKLLTQSEPDPTKRTEAAWSAYCQTLFAANEFIYVR